VVPFTFKSAAPPISSCAFYACIKLLHPFFCASLVCKMLHHLPYALYVCILSLRLLLACPHRSTTFLMPFTSASCLSVCFCACPYRSTMSWCLSHLCARCFNGYNSYNGYNDCNGYNGYNGYNGKMVTIIITVQWLQQLQRLHWLHGYIGYNGYNNYNGNNGTKVTMVTTVIMIAMVTIVTMVTMGGDLQPGCLALCLLHLSARCFTRCHSKPLPPLLHKMPFHTSTPIASQNVIPYLYPRCFTRCHSVPLPPLLHKMAFRTFTPVASQDAT